MSGGKRIGYRLALLAVALLSVANAGCAALVIGGAAAAAGAAGYAYYKGGVYQEYPADLDRTWSATVAALGDLGMPVRQVQRGVVNGEIESETIQGVRVHVTVSPGAAVTPGPQAPPSATKVYVRVGVFGDVPMSEHLLDQVGFRLQNPGAPSPVPALGGPLPAQAVVPAGATAPAGPAQTAPPPLAAPPGGAPQTLPPPLGPPQSAEPPRAGGWDTPAGRGP